jgi:putative pyoverdin transport system ATP-binding/permease protein
MKLLALLWRYSRSLIVLAIIAGVISGLSNAGLIAMIHMGLRRDGTSIKFVLAGFLGLCLLLPICRVVSQMLLTHLAQKAIYDLRVGLSRRILSAPLRQLEEVGAPRLLASLTDDVLAITSGISSIPVMCLHISILVGCLAYLAFLSWTVFIAVFVFLIVGMASFQFAMLKAVTYTKRARDHQDKLFGHLHALTDGTKELKLHRARRESFLTSLLQRTAASYQRNNVIASGVYTAAGSWAQFLFFLLIGMVVFLVPAISPGISFQTLAGYTLTLLYMVVPLDVLSSSGSDLGRARVALDKVEALGLSLHEKTTENAEAKEDSRAASWDTIKLSGVTHTYNRERENSVFTLGPIDLTLRRGEVIFLIGGNGSGKTTLAKLLAGLYSPEDGDIRLDGETITNENRDEYRQLFSAVFSDFYIFDSLLGLDNDNLDARAREYLVELQLNHKVEVKDGLLSTVDLSQGQRKRLALLTAYLEDRSIYLFDEWAADQDPLFRDIFYHQFVPELKARGKTVIVISHDDRYYHVGDRVVKLDYGQIVNDEQSSPAYELAASGSIRL